MEESALRAVAFVLVAIVIGLVSAVMYYNHRWEGRILPPHITRVGGGVIVILIAEVGYLVDREQHEVEIIWYGTPALIVSNVLLIWGLLKLINFQREREKRRVASGVSVRRRWTDPDR